MVETIVFDDLQGRAREREQELQILTIYKVGCANEKQSQQLIQNVSEIH